MAILTLLFIYSLFVLAQHNVHMHMYNDCNETGAILIGDVTPVYYTFTKEDEASGEVVMACDVGQHCTYTYYDLLDHLIHRR